MAAAGDARFPRADRGARPPTLDSGGSAGDIDSLSCSGPDGITLTGADQAKATFTAPNTATSLTFTLTVKSGTTTKTGDVVIKVNPANPAQAQIAPVGATVAAESAALRRPVVDRRGEVRVVPGPR